MPWLVKSEPSEYAWSQLEADKKTAWTGIRNFEARNNLREMKKGDLVLYYHSGEGKVLVGVAKVVKEAFADPTAPKGQDWAAVELAPVAALKSPVSLATVKASPKLKQMQLVTRGRLSVTKVTPEELAAVLALAKTKLKAR